jgi:hypothetical protein
MKREILINTNAWEKWKEHSARYGIDPIYALQETLSWAAEIQKNEIKSVCASFKSTQSIPIEIDLSEHVWKILDILHGRSCYSTYGDMIIGLLVATECAAHMTTLGGKLVDMEEQ